MFVAFVKFDAPVKFNVSLSPPFEMRFICATCSKVQFLVIFFHFGFGLCACAFVRTSNLAKNDELAMMMMMNMID